MYRGLLGALAMCVVGVIVWQVAPDRRKAELRRALGASQKAAGPTGEGVARAANEVKSSWDRWFEWKIRDKDDSLENMEFRQQTHEAFMDAKRAVHTLEKAVRRDELDGLWPRAQWKTLHGALREIRQALKRLP